MPSGFPYDSSGNQVIDAFSNPTAANNLSSPNHADLHTNVNDAITRIESTLAGRAGGRNLLYNGAMQIAQRGTSTASITTSGYYTADRWRLGITTQGTWTQSVDTDVPTGSGFRKSLKMLCTAADAAPAAADSIAMGQKLEGQDLQSIRKGTSSAQQLVVSFWVKSNVTGTYICELFDENNTRQISKPYTIVSSGTWEFKTLTFPADTTGAFANDNNQSLSVFWWLGSGSNFTSGSLNSSAWASSVAGNRAAGQVNLASAINNYWQVTGVQLTVGAYAQPFEFKSFERELRECQRYYQRLNASSVYGQFGWGTASATNNVAAVLPLLVPMRSAPTAGSLEYSNVGLGDSQNPPLSPSSASLAHTATGTVLVNFAVTGATQYRPYFPMANNNASAYIGYSAEL